MFSKIAFSVKNGPFRHIFHIDSVYNHTKETDQVFFVPAGYKYTAQAINSVSITFQISRLTRGQKYASVTGNANFSRNVS